MRQITRAGRRPLFVKTTFAGMATAAAAAVGAITMVPVTTIATMPVLPVAAIDVSSSTIGFADSDLYGMTPAQIDAQLNQMQAMGVNDVRVMIPWAGVEFYPGYYDWSIVDYVVNAADSRGMGVLGVINSTPFWATQPGQPALSGAPASPQAFGDFTGLVAQRYAGKVGAYEIWNEPNAYIFYSPTPDPAGYTDLLKAAYPAIKAADPNATVIGGVLGSVITYGNLTMNPVDFVNGIYAAGGEPYFDALSFHPYQYTTPFSQGGYLPDSPINQLAAMHDVMVANGDGAKLIWASEYGEPSSVAGEANQAAYLNDMLTTWRTLGYTGPAFVWTLQDRNSTSTNPEDTFGVIRTDGTWKPAAYVISQLASQPSTTPTMARMALALPDAQQAAPTDLAALTALAQSTVPVVALQPETPLAVTPPATPQPATLLAVPAQVAATALAAAGQAVADTAAQVADATAQVAHATGQAVADTAAQVVDAAAVPPVSVPVRDTAPRQPAAPADPTRTPANRVAAQQVEKPSVKPATPKTPADAPTEPSADSTKRSAADKPAQSADHRGTSDRRDRG